VQLVEGWRIAERVTLEPEHVRGVEQAVHGGTCKERVAEEDGELFDVMIGRHDRCGAVVARTDDLVEVDGLVFAERLGADVVDDEQVDVGEAGQLAAIVTGAARAPEGAKQLASGGVADPAAGAVAEGLRNVAFAPPARPRSSTLSFLSTSVGATSRTTQSTESPSTSTERQVQQPATAESSSIELGAPSTSHRANALRTLLPLT
jgi:hypothetical protein